MRRRTIGATGHSCPRSQIAPVSIRASPGISSAKALPNRFACSLCAPGVVASQYSKATRRRSMQPPLHVRLRGFSRVSLEPFTHSHIHNRGNRYFAKARLPFQVRLEFARHAPTIYFGFHALHCSASHYIVVHSCMTGPRRVCPPARAIC
jgi:hypothetical protein